MAKTRQRKPWTEEQKAAARERLAKAREARGTTPKRVQDPAVAQLAAENARLKALLEDKGMTVEKEELPFTPDRFKDDEDWHYYLCIKSKSDEEDEEAEKCSRDPQKGGYSVAPDGRISNRKVWLRIPQALFKSRKQAAADEARARWQRPEGQDVRDSDLVARREQREQYVGAQAQ